MDKNDFKFFKICVEEVPVRDVYQRIKALRNRVYLEATANDWKFKVDKKTVFSNYNNLYPLLQSYVISKHSLIQKLNPTLYVSRAGTVFRAVLQVNWIQIMAEKRWSNFRYTCFLFWILFQVNFKGISLDA